MLVCTVELARLQVPNCALRPETPELFTRRSVLICAVSFPFPAQQHPFLCDPSDCTLKADSHIACRAHDAPMPFPCHAGECVFYHLICRVRPCLIHTCHAMPMPHPCHALTMPSFSRPRHSMAVERRPVSYLPAFGFFRLPRGVPQRLLSEAYQSSSQRSIPTT